MKPHAKIFKTALDRLDKNITPQEVIYIDDIKEYVDASMSFGMQGIVYYSYSHFVIALRKLGVYLP